MASVAIEPSRVDPTKLDALLARALGDLSAGYGGVLISIGDKLGLYKAMAGAGPLSSRELAEKTGCAERYLREWLAAQAAGGYVDYYPVSDTYELTPEQAYVLADEDSPAFMPNAWNIPASMWAVEDKAVDAIRTGRGIAWSEHNHRLAHGVANFYRNAYRASLLTEWLPSLDGVVEQLEAGITVADVGCGHGHSTILMAQAFPHSRFHGVDTHAESIAAARRYAEEAGVADRVTFEVARAAEYFGTGYGLICFFDSLHDLGDPVAAARHAAAALAPQGSVLLVEPFANDRLEDNISPIARLYYSVSMMVCCAHAISEGGSLVLGAQAGEARLADVFRKGGFNSVRRTAATPFNLVLEIRK